MFPIRTLSLVLVFALSSPLFAGESLDFNRDIKPLLSNNCFRCHGPDGNERKGGTKEHPLRLDTFAGATRDLGGYSALKAGDPDASDLIKRITTTDPDDRMPPPKSGRALKPKEIEILREWISSGGQYDQHWAYVKPERPEPPFVKNAKWPRNPIDAFILARLEKEGLSPVREADRATLIRRVTIDLTGLPPSLEEVEAFEKDQRPDAYEKLVDQLLASSAYGERWARVWLDLARYADSAGYANDPGRTIWGYRDWVIRAINSNMRYDRFTIEQLAGDLLQDPSDDQLIATAFHRNTRTNSEGGTADEEFRTAAIVDRVNTTMQVWMGTTMACAQCHTHKYDPISQEEYFRFYAFLNNTADADRQNEEPKFKVYSEEQRKKRDEWNGKIAALEKQLQQPLPGDALNQWLAGFDTAKVKWHPLQGPLGEQKITALRVTGNKVLASLNFHPEGSVDTVKGRYVRVTNLGANQFLHLAEVQVFGRGENLAKKWGKASQISTGFGGPAKLAIDGNTDGHYTNAKSTSHTESATDPWWEVDLGAEFPLERIVVWNRSDSPAVRDRLKNWKLEVFDANRQLVKQEQVTPPPANSREFALSGIRGFQVRSFPLEGVTQLLIPEKPLTGLNGFRLQPLTGSHHFSTDPRFVNWAAQPEAMIRLGLKKNRSPQEQEKLAAFHRDNAPETANLRKEIAMLKKQRDGFSAATSVPIMKELIGTQRRKTQVMVRGNYLVKEEKLLNEGVPAVFNPLPEGLPANRLSLAKWLMHEDNPLTARVTANRYWEALFGTGIVGTSEEFGSQGELPSHPELLDWLATELHRNGWDTRELIKLMVSSATYRQGSELTASLAATDPRNRLLARGPRVRMSAEMIRDNALAVSGLLSRKMYGAPVKPPRPKLNLKAAFGGSTDWNDSTGEDRYRRGIYTFWQRSLPYPSMATFDAPSREVCTLSRSRTNTPLQALVLLNDPVFVECARALGKRMIEQGGKTLEERAAFGMRLTLTREPSAEEMAQIRDVMVKLEQQFDKDPATAKKFAPDKEQYAYANLGHILLNLDEFISKR